MIYISAGHHAKDPGAVANGLQENNLTMELRDMVVFHLKRMTDQVVTDKDTETLAEYLRRIQTDTKSVVLEFHFDAANGTASGATALIGNDGDRMDKAFAADLSKAVANTLQIPNRGVKTEGESHRGRLGLMREHGIVCLLEIAFIDNKNDMMKYEGNKKTLALALANVINRYRVLANAL